MANDLGLNIYRARLSYNDLQLRNPKWDNIMTNDYLGIGAASFDQAQQVDKNTQDILQLDIRVTQNESDIGALQISVSGIQVQLNDHIAETSAHGVTGVVVGTENFCTTAVGGVVLLMELVNDAVDSGATVILDDVGAAPAVYSQTYEQEQTDMLNDIKAKHNQLLTDMNLAVAQLNDMIAKSKTAKQMNMP